jgi:small subunit ribosomal protein S19
MTRSVWKGPFVDASVDAKPPTNNDRLWSRRSTVMPEFVGNKVRVHNGKGFISVHIQEEMIGLKFGAFAMTRKRTRHKKKVVRKKK